MNQHMFLYEYGIYSLQNTFFIHYKLKHTSNSHSKIYNQQKYDLSLHDNRNSKPRTFAFGLKIFTRISPLMRSINNYSFYMKTSS